MHPQLTESGVVVFSSVLQLFHSRWIRNQIHQQVSQSSEKAKTQEEGVCQPWWEVPAGRQVSFGVFSSKVTGLITNLLIVISYFK